MQVWCLPTIFLHGNTAVDRNLSWEEKVQCYHNAYLAAKAEGDKLDFDVIFGIEHAYGAGKEVLFYGIDLEFLLANPDMLTITLDELAERVHKAGGIMVEAHPFRIRSYIDPNASPCLDLIDGIEVYNTGNKTAEENIKALRLAKEHGGIMTSGSDYHGWPDEPTNRAGIALPYRVHTGAELVAALKAGDHQLIVNFETVDTLSEDLF